MRSMRGGFIFRSQGPSLAYMSQCIGVSTLTRTDCVNTDYNYNCGR
jgi:hypothetical protein